MNGTTATIQQQQRWRLRRYYAERAALAKAADVEETPPEFDEVDRFINAARQAVIQDLIADAQSKMQNAATPIAAAVHKTRLERLKYRQPVELMDDDEVAAGLQAQLEKALEDDDPQVREVAQAALLRLADTFGDLGKVAVAVYRGTLMRLAGSRLPRPETIDGLRQALHEARERWPQSFAGPSADVAKAAAPEKLTEKERAALRTFALRARLDPTAGRAVRRPE